MLAPKENKDQLMVLNDGSDSLMFLVNMIITPIGRVFKLSWVDQ